MLTDPLPINNQNSMLIIWSLLKEGNGVQVCLIPYRVDAKTLLHSTTVYDKWSHMVTVEIS